MEPASIIELLSPAKDYHVGKAAIDCGADAVYIAAQRFGAREAAGNAMADIERLIRYAHRYYAKVYLALNTMLYDHELEAARTLAVEAWQAGIDAVIVQDMALLEMNLPPVPLFASTQTHNATPEKVKFLQDVGFRRVILARELSLEQIRRIRQCTEVDLEFFVHGALCVCYSGQCYLSEALTGRSANRGACAQPCRNTYDLLDATGRVLVKDKHLLSPLDLNLSRSLPELLQAGVTSFKIEGRLKNESYVKNTVSHYRQQLDALLTGTLYKKASSGSVAHFFTPNPASTFSRGFTGYFLHGRPNRLASFHTAKAVGEEIGVVTALHPGHLYYKGSAVLHNADGLCFFDRRDRLCGTKVNKVEGEKVFVQSTQGLQVGAVLYRNYDHAFEKQLQHPAMRTIAVDLWFTATASHIRLAARDEDGVEAELSVFDSFSPAGDLGKINRGIAAQLEKTGNTIFKVRRITLQNDPAYFFPVSTLNQWRRDLLALLETAREQQRQRPQAVLEPNAVPYPDATVDYRANVANALAQQFYARHGVAVAAPAFETAHPQEAHYMRTKYCLKHELGYCPKQNPGKALPEPLFLLNNGRKIELAFDCKNCEMALVM
ncbi:MAG: U32 family peptidase [Prevotellaceae bacterium]|jgi:putative protease|nr:U32 family peptidase [Prevotellaceae bacterium]